MKPDAARRPIEPDAWQRHAQDVYDASAESKSAPRRYARFVKACGAVARHIGIDAATRVLDVGCGCGELAQALEASGTRHYVGIDISAGSLRVARRLNRSAGLVRADVTAPCVADEACDVAVALTVLEFCADKPRALQQIHRALVPQGRLYVEVRNAGFWPLRFFGKLGLVAGYDAPGFRDLGVAEWQALLQEAGFIVEQTTRALRPPGGRGGIIGLLKDALIAAVSRVAPVSGHYMIGLTCRKAASS